MHYTPHTATRHIPYIVNLKQAFIIILINNSSRLTSEHIIIIKLNSLCTIIMATRARQSSTVAFHISVHLRITRFSLSPMQLAWHRGDICIFVINCTIIFSFLLSVTGHIPYPSGVVTLIDLLQFSLTSAVTTDPPVFALTCVSTGGPATTVTWTRNGNNVSYDATHVLTQTVTDQLSITYSNVLIVTKREPGSYQCSVTNDRTAQPLVSVSLTVAGEWTACM